jgi:NAD(P)-dependent dehydrogenase (short-subunit alcohol dehydrogenase family)
MFRDLFALDGKLALVSGGSGGIGRGAARVLQELGARLIITGNSDEHLEEVAELLSAGGEVTALLGDARDADHVDDLVRTAERLGGVDVLVNSIGTQRRMPLLQATGADLDFLWSVNMGSVFDLTQRLLPQMVAKGYGKVIQMCSIVGSVVAVEEKAMYAITKAALTQYTRSSALELAPYGIRVNGIAPGYVDTPMTHAYIHSDREEEYLSAIPLGRFADVGDLAGAFAYLSSRASDHMTGQVLVIDGGETLR